MDKKHIKTYKSNKIISLEGCKILRWDSLNNTQLKLIMLSASKVKPDDDRNTKYSISFKEYADFCGFTKSGDNYDKIYEDADKLSHSGVNYETKDGDTIIFVWLNQVTLSRSKGYFTYYLDDRLLPFYKTKNGNFAVINLVDYMPLRSRYSLLLYELLASWQINGKVYKTIEQLRTQLEVPENKYNRVADFLAWVIKPAVAEINSKSQYSFKVEIIEKKGKRRTTEGIEFILKPIKTAIEETLSPELAELVELLASLGVERPAAIKLVKSYPKDAIIQNIKFAKAEDKKEKRANFAGFLCRAIADNWAAQNPKSSEKKPAPPVGSKLLANPNCEKCFGEGGTYYRPSGTTEPLTWLPCRCTEQY